MKSRGKIEKIILGSGIFKVGPTGEPEGVFALSPKDYPDSIGEHTIKEEQQKRKGNSKEQDATQYLFSDLCNILSRYYNEKRSQVSFTLWDAMQEIETRITEILTEYLPEDEAKAYAKQFWKTRLKSRPDLSRLEVHLKARLKETGAFEQHQKDARRYFDLLLPLQQAFDEHLKLERGTNYYLTHFLIGAKMERGKFRTVYDRVRQFMHRKDSLFESEPTIRFFEQFQE